LIAESNTVLTLSVALLFYGAMAGSMDVAMNTHAVMLDHSRCVMDTCGLERVERFRVNLNEKNFASQKNTLTSSLPQRCRAVGKRLGCISCLPGERLPEAFPIKASDHPEVGG
jgi:hypothetical protein